MKGSRYFYRILLPVAVGSILLGGLLGYLSLKWKHVDDPENVFTTVPPTTAITPVTTMPISPEELLYHAYMEAAEPGECTYQDMDGDGTDELLVNRYGGLNEIVTIRDGKAESLLSASDLFLCKDNVIGQYGEGSGGSTIWFCKVENQQLKNLDCLVWMFQENAWYRSPDYTGEWDTMVPITEEERWAVVEQYPPLEMKSGSFMDFIYCKN